MPSQIPTAGVNHYVTPDGDDSETGLSLASSKLTVQAAVDAASAGDVIYIAPGSYDEEVTIANAKSKLTLVGMGPRLSVSIAPQGGNKTALTVKADDVTLINLDFDGEGTGAGMVSNGRRLHADHCKFEGGTDAVIMAVGTDAQITAGTDENGSDWLLEDCEVAWSTNGLVIRNSDYGANTQGRMRRGVIHNISGASVLERVGSGGSAPVQYRNLELTDIVFDDLEGGTAPTKYVDLAADNANDGIMSGCRFPQALAGGKVTVSTALTVVGCYFTDGVSTGQPS